MNIRHDSQNARLLVHLAQGKKLTRLSALFVFGVQNITARITEMRVVVDKLIFGVPLRYNFDYTIVGTTKADANGRAYMEYSIPERAHRVILGRYLQTLRRAA